MSWLSDLFNRLFRRDPVDPPPPPADTNDLLARHNWERAHRGLKQLTLAANLTAMATEWATAMARSGVISHAGFAARAAQHNAGGMCGENVAEGQTSPAAVMASWMSSPGHRANILSADFAKIGFAVAYAGGVPYWCVDFSA